MRENASGWIVKILFAIIIIVFVFAFGMSGLNSSGDPVVASVNGQMINRAEFEEAYQRMAEAFTRSNPNVSAEQVKSAQFKQLVLGELISKKLLLAEAEKLGISASNEEVVQGIAEQSMFKNADGVFDKNIYQAALRSIRMTPAAFEEEFRQGIIMEKVREAASEGASVTPEQARQMYDWVGEQVRMDYLVIDPQDYTASVTVSDEEVKKYYDDNIQRFTTPAQVKLRYLAFTPEALARYEVVTDEEIKAAYEATKDTMQQGEQVNARHILVMVKDSDPEEVKEQAKKKIDKVLELAKSGKDFAELAKEYSEGPSNVRGGELGWFGRGQMVPEFEAVAFDTPKGEVSGLVKTQFGWHIIKVEDRKEASIKTLAEARSQLKSELAQEKASDKISDLLDQAMDRLVSGMSLDEIAKELGVETMTPATMPVMFLSQALGLNADATKLLEGLPEGEIHQAPLAVNGGYMIVEKLEDIPAAPMDIAKVKDSIVNSLKVVKATDMAKAEAEKIIGQLNGGEGQAYADRIKTTEPFDRQGNIPGLGQSKTLVENLFLAKDTNWLSTPYALQSGVVIVRLNERIPASEETWKEQKDFWMEQAGNTYKQEVMAAFMDELSKGADVEIARPDLLQ